MLYLYCQQDNATKQIKRKGDVKVLLKLRGKRVEYGYTQAEFAKAIGISLYAYQLKERGKVEFRMGEINSILKLLNCTYEEIFFNQ